MATPTSSSSANVSWSAPETPNGVVRLYRVGYYRTEEGLGDTEAQQVNTTSTNAELSGLNFYTNYTIVVQAFTVAFGPTSDAITVLTGEDGRCDRGMLNSSPHI